jgi:hypothetical protein
VAIGKHKILKKQRKVIRRNATQWLTDSLTRWNNLPIQNKLQNILYLLFASFLGNTL